MTSGQLVVVLLAAAVAGQQEQQGGPAKRWQIRRSPFNFLRYSFTGIANRESKSPVPLDSTELHTSLVHNIDISIRDHL